MQYVAYYFHMSFVASALLISIQGLSFATQFELRFFCFYRFYEKILLDPAEVYGKCIGQGIFMAFSQKNPFLLTGK